MSKKSFFLISIFCILLSITTSKAQEPSLYSRLGSVYGISAVVDDFVDKLLSNPTVTANETVIAAMNRINKPGLKYLITEMICEASGGPQKYTGKKMKEAHQSLNISEAEWEATVKELISSLNKFNVPEKEQNELLAIVASTKSDIVLQKKPEAVPQASPIPSIIPQASPALPSPEASPEAPKPEPSPDLQKILDETIKALPDEMPAIQEAPKAKPVAPVVKPYIPRKINPDEIDLPDFAE